MADVTVRGDHGADSGDPAIDLALRRLCDPLRFGSTEDWAIADLLQIGPRAIPALTVLLRSGNATEPLRGVRVLAGMHTAASQDALRDYLRESLAHQPAVHRGRRAKTQVLWSWLPCVAVYLAHHWWADVTGVLSGALTGYAGVNVGYAIVCYDRFSRARRAAVSAIVDADDISDIDLLVRCLDDGDPGVRTKTIAGLQPILRRMQASDAARLSPEAANGLIKELAGTQTRLILAILAVLDQVGDERALSAVERLASGRGAGRKPDVRLAADACLPALRERVDRSQSAHGLLRPAVADESAGTLVRPIRSMDAETGTLVQPAGRDGSAVE